MKLKYHAYWISETEILPVPTTHIETVIQYPEKFGYTRERIEQIYCKHNEPVGFDGYARQEIMRDIIVNNRWIRARYSPRYDRWTFETSESFERIKHSANCFLYQDIKWPFYLNSDIRILRV